MLSGPCHREALFFISLAIIVAFLQGCATKEDRKDSNAALELCPAFTFSGNGFVAQARAGQLVDITCPSDYTYSGPAITCSWVNRFCVAPTSRGPIDLDLCYNQYNLTLQGEGLTVWPAGVDPQIVPPPTAGGPPGVAGGMPVSPAASQGGPLAWVANASGRLPNSSQIDVGRRLAGALPRVITAAQLACTDEAYTDLDFEGADVEIGSLLDAAYPWSLRYKEIATVGGVKIDLLVTTDRPNISSETSGKGSAMGRINCNTSHALPFSFKFVHTDRHTPVVLRKVFLTLFDISDSADVAKGKEVTVSSFQEYFLTAKTGVAVTKLETGEYTFGRAQPFGQTSALQPGPAGATPSLNTQLSVKDMWLDSLNRSVVLMFRNTSEFLLNVRVTPGPNGRDFEFSGWSEVVSIERKMFVGKTLLDSHVERYSSGRRWTPRRPWLQPWANSGILTASLVTSAAVSFLLLRRIHGSADVDSRAAYTACSAPDADGPMDRA